jgi:hypothetical protein
MWKYTVLLTFLLLARMAAAHDKPENWLEVRSQHFTVVTNANEKAGRRIADQFERMRSVFHVAFPHVAHRGNYYKIEFTTLGFSPKGDLSPCKDLEGRPAKVEYVDPGVPPATAYVVAIELHK